MGENIGVLQTDTRDLTERDWKIRGTRLWSKAEARSDTIFILEGFEKECNASLDKPVRVLTPSFFEALSTCEAWQLKNVTIMVYAYISNIECQQRVFGSVIEALGSLPSKPLFLKLDTGMMLSLGNHMSTPHIDLSRKLFPM